MTEVTVKVGDAITLVDEQYVEHAGLVTAVHGYGSRAERDDALRKCYREDDGQLETALAVPFTVPPCINAVFVSADAAKHDPYGRQVERLSSLQHESQVQSMPRPGRFWRN